MALFIANVASAQKKYSGWNCPDDKTFAPVNIKDWYKVPVVNDRLPTLQETKNGKAVIYFEQKMQAYIRPLTIKLPQLAIFYNTATKKEEIVIVIQAIKTETETVLGYRFLTGGVGTDLYDNFRFLSDNEIAKRLAK
jgi:hypothetical protein